MPHIYHCTGRFPIHYQAYLENRKFIDITNAETEGVYGSPEIPIR